MRKQLIVCCTAVVAGLAFTALAMASTASAAPVLTAPTGTVAATGTAVTAVSVGAPTMTTGSGSVACDTATMSGTLTTNSTASGSKVDITSALAHNVGSTECSSWTGGTTWTFNVAGGLPWCLETTSDDEIRIRGGKCSELPRGIKFTLDFTSIGACEYNRTTAATGTLVTHPEDAVVSLAKHEWTKVGGGALCPSSGSLDMSFTLKAGGNTAYFSS